MSNVLSLPVIFYMFTVLFQKGTVGVANGSLEFHGQAVQIPLFLKIAMLEFFVNFCMLRFSFI